METRIRLISLEESLPVREFVLRAGRPRSEAVFPGEDDPKTFHLGAVVAGEVVATASFYFEEHPEMTLVPAERQYRLRGMASLPEVRSMGLGTRLLQTAFPMLRERGCRLVWCNARIKAVDFYRRNGFMIVGQVFEIPHSGSHYLMFVPLGVQ